MKFIYNNLGEVKMIANGDIDYDTSIFSAVDIDPTPEEQEKIDQKYLIKIVDGSLVFELNPAQEEVEKKQQLVQSINNAQSLSELKEILTQILQ